MKEMTAAIARRNEFIAKTGVNPYPKDSIFGKCLKFMGLLDGVMPYRCGYDLGHEGECQRLSDVVPNAETRRLIARLKQEIQ